jgi:hypothetical protein
MDAPAGDEFSLIWILRQRFIRVAVTMALGNENGVRSGTPLPANGPRQ